MITKRKAVLLAIMLIAFGLRTYMLAEKEFGVDEKFTVNFIKKPFSEIILSLQTSEPHPPLYYFLAKASFILSSSYIFVKMLSVICGVMAVLILFRFANIAFNKHVAVFSTLLLALNPLAVAYSQHMRPYALMGFLFISLVYCLYLFLEERDRSKLPWIVSLNTFILLTHYVGFIIIGCELLFLLYMLKEKKAYIKEVILITLGPLALSSLWFMNTLNTLGKAARIVNKRPTLFDFFYVFYKFSAGVNLSFLLEKMPLTVPLVLVVATIFVLGTIYVTKSQAWSFFLFLFFTPIAGTFIFSQFTGVLFYF